jgi:hypothetical protein
MASLKILPVTQCRFWRTLRKRGTPRAGIALHQACLKMSICGGDKFRYLTLLFRNRTANLTRWLGWAVVYLKVAVPEFRGIDFAAFEVCSGLVSRCRRFQDPPFGCGIAFAKPQRDTRMRAGSISFANAPMAPVFWPGRNAAVTTKRSLR